MAASGAGPGPKPNYTIYISELDIFIQNCAWSNQTDDYIKNVISLYNSGKISNDPDERKYIEKISFPEYQQTEPPLMTEIRKQFTTMNTLMINYGLRNSNFTAKHSAFILRLHNIILEPYMKKLYQLVQSIPDRGITQRNFLLKKLNDLQIPPSIWTRHDYYFIAQLIKSKINAPIRSGPASASAASASSAHHHIGHEGSGS